MRNSQKAFTLIELLVVISIIGLLSSIVLASLQDARAKARDARRLSDMKTLENAIALYRFDHNDQPPPQNRPGEPSYYIQSSNNNPNFISELVSERYLSSGITDPVNSGQQFYVYETNTQIGCNSNNKAALFYLPELKTNYGTSTTRGLNNKWKLICIY